MAQTAKPHVISKLFGDITNQIKKIKIIQIKELNVGFYQEVQLLK